MPAEARIAPGPDSPLSLWLDYIDQVHPSTIAMGLERLQVVAARMPALPARWHVITVAGTNGKGSTVTALESLLLAAGYRVGATLSPHIEDFEERIRVGGRSLSAAAISRSFAAVEAHRQDVPLTYFEYAALAALTCFAAAELDVVLLEIGLGGRLDAFNLIDADTAVITSIGLDHQSYLGDTRSAIGREKAGILRSGQRVCLGREMPQSVLEAAAALGLTPLGVDRELRLEEGAGSWRVRCEPEGWDTQALPDGPFVSNNGALALAAAWPLLQAERAQPVDLVAWARALAMPGRREIAQAWNRRWLLDVGHNPLAALSLAQWLPTQLRGQRCIAVFGSLADKDAPAIAAALQALVLHWVLVPTGAAGARGLTAAQLAERLAGADLATLRLSQAANLDQGLRVAAALSEPEVPVLVFGAFAVVGAARTALGLASGAET